MVIPVIFGADQGIRVNLLAVSNREIMGEHSNRAAASSGLGYGRRRDHLGSRPDWS